MNDLQNATGNLSPHGIYTHVYINGLYWGMYCIHERPDDAFLAEYLGGSPEDYDVIKHGPFESARTGVVAGSNTDYLQMFDDARAGLADNNDYQDLQQ